MRLPSKGEVLGVTAAFATIGGLAGCGGGSSAPSPRTAHKAPNGPAKIQKVLKGPAANTRPFHGILRCAAIDPSRNWAQTPTNMNASLIAQAIGRGVTAEQVADGQMGTAHCQQGIEVGQVDMTKATVQGIGDLCLVVGLGSAPKPHKTYHQILAVCAADAVPFPSATE